MNLRHRITSAFRHPNLSNLGLACTVGLASLLLPNTACSAHACLRWFDAQPRYQAVKAFDGAAFTRMRARVRALGDGGPDCA
jgi:hypothetical protein